MNFTKQPILHNLSIELGDTSNLELLNKLRKESGKRISPMGSSVGYSSSGKEVKANITHLIADFSKHTFDLYAAQFDVSCKYEIDLISSTVIEYMRSLNGNDFNIYSLELNFKLEGGKISPFIVMRGDA